MTMTRQLRMLAELGADVDSVSDVGEGGVTGETLGIVAGTSKAAAWACRDAEGLGGGAALIQLPNWAGTI
jgi:hypothetical protein